MTDFYNDIDPFACEWTRQLIQAGHVPAGVVDERSIKGLVAADLVGRRRAHFFNGLSGWGLALELAGFPAGRTVFTGSAPCQPYSSAGKQKGDADERNLWPELFRLIRACKPSVAIGEQVSSAIRHGWLDGIRADLVGAGYEFGAVVLGAAAVGAPHQRQRLYWVASRPADADGVSNREQWHCFRCCRKYDKPTCGEAWHPDGSAAGVYYCPECRGLGNASGERLQERVGDGRLQRGPGRTVAGQAAELRGDARRLGDTIGDDLGRDAGGAPGPQGGGERGRALDGHGGQQPRRAGATRGVGDAASERLGEAGRPGVDPRLANVPAGSDAVGFWDAYALIPCRDGKSRRVPAETQSGVQPLVARLSPGVDGVRTPCRGRHPLTAAKIEGRAGLLKGAGNAICVPTAVAFIRAFLDSETGGAA